MLNRILIGHNSNFIAGNKISLYQLQLTSDDIISYLIPYLTAHPKITHLDLSYNFIDKHSARALLKHSHLQAINLSSNSITDFTLSTSEINPNLTELNLSHTMLTDQSIHLLNQMPLVKLKLSDTQITDRGAVALAKSSTITALDLSYNDITADGAKALFANEYLQDLKLCKINFSSQGSKFKRLFRLLYENTLHELGIIPKQSWIDVLEHNTTLRKLDLSFNEFAPGYVRRILAATHLTDLSLDNSNISDKELFNVYLSSRLANLNLSHNNITREGFRHLISSSLTRLTLHKNNIAAINAAMLIKQLPQLKTLAAIDSLDQETMAAALSLPQLSDAWLSNAALTLNNVNLSEQLSEILLPFTVINAESFNYLLKLTNLQVLDLSYGNLTGDALKAIGKNTSLKSLSLTSNNIGNLGWRYLMGNHTLTSLYLEGNNIGNISLGLQHNYNLIYLSLNDNPIGDMGISGIEYNSTLMNLHLMQCQISALGAGYLAKNSCLINLILHFNPINDNAAYQLSCNSSLTYLGLNSTQITDRGAILLASKPNYKTLTLLNNTISPEIQKTLSTANIVQKSIRAATVGKVPSLIHLSLFKLQHSKPEVIEYQLPEYLREKYYQHNTINFK